VDHFVQAGTAKVVVMACRNVHKCDAARDKIVQKSPDSRTKIIPIQLDLANKTSIEDFASILPDRLRDLKGEEAGDSIPTIDVLMNNAGIFASSPYKEFIEGIESHLWVNHLAHVFLTHLLWPNLVEGKGRVVTISSITALLPFSPNDWWSEDHVVSFLNPFHEGLRMYARSKRANILFAHELHRRFSPDVSAVSSHPGISWTQI
jgi:NAD(P)-dependent dehydrogenase (short-subunit alcohol dehydrogenase family)